MGNTLAVNSSDFRSLANGPKSDLFSDKVVPIEDAVNRCPNGTTVNAIPLKEAILLEMLEGVRDYMVKEAGLSPHEWLEENGEISFLVVIPFPSNLEEMARDALVKYRHYLMNARNYKEVPGELYWAVARGPGPFSLESLACCRSGLADVIEKIDSMSHLLGLIYRKVYPGEQLWDAPQWPPYPPAQEKHGHFAFTLHVYEPEGGKRLADKFVLALKNTDFCGAIVEEDVYCAADGAPSAPVSELVKKFSHRFKDKRTAAAGISRCIREMVEAGLITREEGYHNYYKTSLLGFLAPGWDKAVRLLRNNSGDRTQ